MYWYIKYPLYGLALLVLLGLGYLLWTHLPDDVRRTATFWSRHEPARPPQPQVAKPLALPGPSVRPPPSVRPSVTPPVPPRPPVAATPAPAAPASTAGTARPPPAPAPSATQALEQRLAAAADQLQKDRLLAARTLARKVLEDPAVAPYGEVWWRAADVLSRANTALVNSSAPAPEKLAYIIQPGDALVSIAERHNTTVSALQRANNLDPVSPLIFPGAVLHIYRAQWAVQVDKEHFALMLMDGDQLFKVYRVAIGRQDRTPVGTFRVANKLREPVWTPPGRVIPYGDPRNVLGTRWLGIEPTEGTDPGLKGLGIHGTWEPDSIGKAASEGCVRLLNDDVNELFDLVPVDTRVTIKGE